MRAIRLQQKLLFPVVALDLTLCQITGRHSHRIIVLPFHAREESINHATMVNMPRSVKERVKIEFDTRLTFLDNLQRVRVKVHESMQRAKLAWIRLEIFVVN